MSEMTAEKDSMKFSFVRIDKILLTFPLQHDDPLLLLRPVPGSIGGAKLTIDRARLGNRQGSVREKGELDEKKKEVMRNELATSSFPFKYPSSFLRLPE
jgi:hypothetical protein